MSVADRLNGVRDVFGAYKMLLSLDLDSKPDLSFVVKHLAKVCADTSKKPESRQANTEDSKALERIRAVYKAYEKLKKWVPEKAEKVLVEHLEAVLKSTDAAKTRQQRSKLVQVKRKRLEEIVAKNKELSKSWERIRTVYKRYKNLKQWNPEEAEEGLVEHLDTILGLTDSSTSYHENTKPVQVKRKRTIEVDEEDTQLFKPLRVKKEKREEVVVKHEELVSDSEQGPNQVSTRHQQSWKPVQVEKKTTTEVNGENVELNSGREQAQIRVSTAALSSLLTDLSTVKTKTSYGNNDIHWRRSKNNIIHNINNFGPTKRRLHKKWVKNRLPNTQGNKSRRFAKLEKEMLLKYNPGFLKRARMNFSVINRMPVKRSVTLHQRTHTGENNYKCKQCPKVFAGHSAMREHEKTHDTTREGKYKYHVFPKKLLYKGSLKEHEKYCKCCKGMPDSTQFNNALSKLANSARDRRYFKLKVKRFKATSLFCY